MTSTSNNKKAIIDIGSNTMRLVIYHYKPNGTYKELENIKAVARLRQYLQEDFVLEDKGIAICLEILEGFKEILEYHHVQSVKCVATATIRQAINKEAIIAKIKQTTGFSVDVLTEEEEAYYGYIAVAHTTVHSHAVTVDIGGGSTEITYFEDKKLIKSYSFPFGVVSLKEKFFNQQSGGRYDTDALGPFIVQSLQSLPWLRALKVPIVAIGGSARNIAQIHQHVNQYPLAGIHQYEMKVDDLFTLEQSMRELSIEEMEKVEGLSKDRIDLILPALEVFVELCKYVEATNFTFSKRGLRDGLIIEEKKSPSRNASDILDESIHSLVLDYGISLEHSDHVANLATKLYRELCSCFETNLNKRSERLIRHSAQIYFIGQYIDFDVSSHHTFNLLANQSIDGLHHKDRLILALIASFKNKALLKQYIIPFQTWFTKDEIEDIRIAGAMVKLASSLDASKRGLIKDIQIRLNKGKDELTFHVSGVGNYFVEKSQALKQVRHLEKALKIKIKLKFIHTSQI